MTVSSAMVLIRAEAEAVPYTQATPARVEKHAMKQQILAQDAILMTIVTVYAIRENPLPTAADWIIVPLTQMPVRKTSIPLTETASAMPATAREISIVMRMLTEVTRFSLNPISAEAS